MKRELAILTIVTLTVCGLTLFQTEYRGVGMVGLLQIAFGFFVGGISLMAALSNFLGYAWSREERWRENGIRCLALAMASGGVLATIPVGRVMLNRDIVEAKAYCEKLALSGRISKAALGKYPESQAEVVSDDRLPRLLRGRQFYICLEGAEGYEFFFHSGPHTTWVFHVGRSEWIVST